MDVLVDGVLRATVARGVAVTIDTRGLDDGWHDLRILGREGTSARSIGQALLDLRRSDEIRISQAAPFAPIRVSKVEQETSAVNERTHAWTARSA